MGSRVFDDVEEEKMRRDMLKIDKLVHTTDNECLQYIIYAAGKEIDRRSEEYMEVWTDKLKRKIIK